MYEMVVTFPGDSLLIKEVDLDRIVRGCAAFILGDNTSLTMKTILSNGNVVVVMRSWMRTLALMINLTEVSIIRKKIIKKAIYMSTFQERKVEAK